MSFEREGRDIVFLCDGVSCHEVLRTDSDDFSTAVEVAVVTVIARKRTTGRFVKRGNRVGDTTAPTKRTWSGCNETRNLRRSQVRRRCGG
jgi:hypothetical protein